MGDLDDDYSHAMRRVEDRLYISRRLPYPKEGPSARFANRLLSNSVMNEVIYEKDEAVFFTTRTGAQQIKAKFFEDGRGISHLWVQRWNTATEKPTGEQLFLRGEQIEKLMEFLEALRRVEIPSQETFNRDFSDYKLVHRADEAALSALEQHPELVAEFARNQVTSEDIVALAYRRGQLETFRGMLDKGDHSEPEWQQFFERNQWIFGYGLSFVFTTGLDGEKLQATIRGASVFKPGKQPDGLLKTRAAISALCLVEIKKSNTRLLREVAYRSGTWAPTGELSGAVAQAQENVRAAIDELSVLHRVTDEMGNPTGEELLTVQPRSFLLVGSLTEFESEAGTNEARFRSFEDYRRNLRQPEILTFDELYERARFIVESSDRKPQEETSASWEGADDIPF
ncbi:MAG: Shedu immune nuclease family protein [Pseudomonadota bacterium]